MKIWLRTRNRNLLTYILRISCSHSKCGSSSNVFAFMNTYWNLEIYANFSLLKQSLSIYRYACCFFLIWWRDDNKISTSDAHLTWWWQVFKSNESYFHRSNHEICFLSEFTYLHTQDCTFFQFLTNRLFLSITFLFPSHWSILLGPSQRVLVRGELRGL